jgi:hypothetical protein
MNTSLPLPNVPPFQEAGTLAVSDQSKWVQKPLTLVKQAQRIPLPQWGLYIVILLFMMWLSSAFSFLQLSHVVFVGVSIVVIYVLQVDQSVADQNEYQTIMTMWKTLDGPTSALYLDANLIIFLYEHRQMAQAHETGWKESIRQINQLLKLSWEAKSVTHDKDGHFALIQQCYEKAMFHFHSIVFNQSEYHAKFVMWKKAMGDLQNLLWVHVEEARSALGLEDTLQLQPVPSDFHKRSAAYSSMLWNAA